VVRHLHESGYDSNQASRRNRRPREGLWTGVGGQQDLLPSIWPSWTTQVSFEAVVGSDCSTGFQIPSLVGHSFTASKALVSKPASVESLAYEVGVLSRSGSAGYTEREKAQDGETRR